jgi:hypothetical protein
MDALSVPRNKSKEDVTKTLLEDAHGKGLCPLPFQPQDHEEGCLKVWKKF